ncbi:putative secondary metabolism biosynthetic enzyme [Arachnomyces sp. PD_36]|nr:putative secondary metabolism biosynthetic enzyme [Arachnomyces sp. PD_36]
MDPEICLNIIAEEVGVSRDELQDDTEFSDLGIDNMLAKVITDRLSKEASQCLPQSVFKDYPDVQSFVRHISPVRVRQVIQQDDVEAKNQTKAKKPSLVVRLQGNPATAKKTIFLLPDGSGSGMAYARIPRLGADICLCGVNSPFLGVGSFCTTIEQFAETFLAAIREVQPHGPYTIGGWSAGGYFTTEVVRLMLRAGETVESILLIDSPCRLEFESLPLEVVRYLAPRNLMGNWGNKDTPTWLVDHFEGTLAAVARYSPTKIQGRVPSVFVIEASDGVFGTDTEFNDTGLDQTKLTKYMLAPRPKQYFILQWCIRRM